MAHVTTGCRDCTKCTNSGVANLGRNSGRAGLAILTVGMSEAVMAGTKNCRICGHKLSLHTGESIVTNRAGVSKKKTTPAGWYRENGNGRMRWWDGNQWTAYQDDWETAEAMKKADAEETASAVRSASPMGATVDEQLAKLAEMFRSGVLNEEEFSAAKRTVLGI